MIEPTLALNPLQYYLYNNFTPTQIGCVIASMIGFVIIGQLVIRYLKYKRDMKPWR